METAYAKRKKILVEMLGGQCKRCGSKEELEFDHLNRKDKKYTITSIYSFSLDFIVKELVKCQLLCKKCHYKKTKLELGVKHGSLGMYRHHKCRCDICKEAQKFYKRKWRAKQKTVGSSPTS